MTSHQGELSHEPSSNSPGDLKKEVSSLINYEAFGKPKKTNEELKRLKNQLQLYRALDSLEFKTQDRRVWRRPQTFSIGHAERRSQFAGGRGIHEESASNALVINSDILESMGNNNNNANKRHGRTESTNSSSGAKNNNKREFEAGPRGIIKALSQATAASPSPVPCPPSLGNSTSVFSGVFGNNQKNNQPPTEKEINEEIAQNEEAAEISELELRRARKQYRDLVARQRAEEEAAMRPMYEAEKEAAAVRNNNYTAPMSSSSNNTKENNNNFMSTSRRRDRDNNKNSASFSSSTRRTVFSERKDVKNNKSDHDDTNTKNEVIFSSSRRRIPAPPSQIVTPATSRPHTANTTTASSSMSSCSNNADHSATSRARVLQFNAFRSGGQTGLQNYLHMKEQRKAQHEALIEQQQRRGGNGNNSSNKENEEDSVMSTSQIRAAAARESRKDAYSVSSHLHLRPDTATHLYKSTHETEKTLEKYEKEVKHDSEQAERDSKQFHQRSSPSSSSPGRATTAPVPSHHRQQQQQQQQQAIPRRPRGYSHHQQQQQDQQKKNNTTTNSPVGNEDRGGGGAVDDPTIESSDPFGFLKEGAENIHAGVSRTDSGAKKDYNQTLQEKLLSLAASRAGVSLSAASAPSRVLGVRPPTADAENAHQMSLEQRDKLYRQQQMQKIRNNNNNGNSNNEGGDSSSAPSSPRVVSVVGALHGSAASSSSAHFNNNNNSSSSAANNQNQNQQQKRDFEEVREGVKKRQRHFQQELENKRKAVKKGDFHKEAPLPFARAGPIERHIPSPRIHPPHSNNARQERNLCRNVHEASRTPGVNAYSLPPQQFAIKSWTKVSSLRGCANAGLMTMPK